jgi:hypothetical protein
MSAVMAQRAYAGLHDLGLDVAAQHLDTLAQQAAAAQWSYTHFLGCVLDHELRAPC